MLDAAWKQWYYTEHELKFRGSSGILFEKYVAEVLKQVDSDFIDPSPKGKIGDEGCDGISGDGETVYACYGKLMEAQSNREKYATDKMGRDFKRAIDKWPDMKTWRFVTNVDIGTSIVRKKLDLRKQYEAVKIEIWGCSDLWKQIELLDENQISSFLDPAPHAQDARFKDIIEAIEGIGSDETDTFPEPRIGKISPEKMDYNKINELNRIAFNQGRQRAPEIEKWFDRQSDAELYDTKAKLLRERYKKVCKSHSNSNETLESLFVYVGGPDFRCDESRSMAVYAVVSFFFDRCDIFKDPNEDSSYLETKESNAVTD